MNAILVATILGSTVTSREYAQNGFQRHWALAASAPFRCVGAFRDGCTGSGTWFYDRYVLTTAHSVVDRPSKGYRNPKNYEYVLVDAKGKEHLFRVRRFYVPSAYFRSIEDPTYWGSYGSDVAVAELDRKPQLEGVSCAVLGFDGMQANTVPTLVAHGMRGTTDQGTLSKFGSGYSDKPPRALAYRCRIRNIDALGHRAVLLFATSANIELQGLGSSCDSGGGAFFEKDGEWQLRGVIATSQAPNFEGPLREESVQMGCISLARFARSLLKGATKGEWEDFVNYDTSL